ncbi:DUF305 domain-containing protein [Blastococcus sp. CT_GayMR19]|uniref:DUF305 domain-containing protein n=1 Tax=Blastococcus sp. CT_GayMR19 TaxID=2559608 RepID=UPI0010740B09|nr:DUF305 domain-containing protein [Blastococcus sp. CT_GayMR19]TFV70813.1 DUF305 domain-containing protein [Blastococcus sp. CT_GayMR19]
MPAATGSRGPLRTVLLAVIAVGLVLLGGGLAVAFGIGRETVPGADSVDAGFARDMSRHHLQGVEMANVALERSEDPEIRPLAFDISSIQTNQAGRMEGWLSLWDLPQSGGEVMAWMTDDGGHAGHSMDMGGMDMGEGTLMPGMATEEELAGLRELSGTAFDVEFLRLMIRHHQGGLEMAEYAAEHADVAAVRRLAATIADTQTAETTTMTDLLTERGGTPLPAP